MSTDVRNCALKVPETMAVVALMVDGADENDAYGDDVNLVTLNIFTYMSTM